METQNFFLGIDLGTTNSVIAYANMRNQQLRPTVLSVPRTSDTGGTMTSPTLPSVVYYHKDKEGRLLPIVGDFAKAQYGKKYGYVVKSVKTSMGSGAVPDINQELPDQTPAAVSSHVLEQLLAGAKKKLILDQVPKDVIITIPASFDSDMRRATLDAAQQAGITAYDGTGRPRNILLYEPKAVLYDFVNSQINGEIPESMLDLTTPKNVLIYDLGGGTLDVSLHQVSHTEGSDLLTIEDIAISRYTNIGGDDFDELIASRLRDSFIEQYGSGLHLDGQAQKEILAIFIKKAEELKIAMNTAYETLAVRGEVLPDDHDEYLSEVNLYNGYPFEAYVTKKELLEYVQPLMGEQLSSASVERFANLTAAADVDNIIYPILDVLVKAKAARGEVPVDYVLLNGGMSKFFPVQERLERFFGKKPITIVDPDMSVAKGAVVYHYYLHKYQVQEHLAVANPVASAASVTSAISAASAAVAGSVAGITQLPGTAAPAGVVSVPREGETAAVQQATPGTTIGAGQAVSWTSDTASGQQPLSPEALAAERERLASWAREHGLSGQQAAGSASVQGAGTAWGQTSAYAVGGRAAGGAEARTSILVRKLPGHALDAAVTPEQARILGTPILNDTLNLAVRGGYVRPLILAGSKLPFASEVFTDFVLPRDCDSIRLPLFYGSGKDMQLPNRKIAERIVRFSRKYPADTAISVQAEIDRYGLISLCTWVTEHPDEIGTVSVDMYQGGQSCKGLPYSTKGLGAKPVLPWLTSGVTVNYKSELNSLRQLLLQKQRYQRSGTMTEVKNVSKELKNLLARMVKAENAASSGEILLEALDKSSNNDELCSRLLGVCKDLYPVWPEREQEALHKCCRDLLNRPYGWVTIKSSARHTQAINVLAKMARDRDVPLLEKLLALQDNAFSCEAAVALAKMGADPSRTIDYYIKLTVYDIPKLNSYVWALGRSCSREVNSYNDSNRLRAAVKHTLGLLEDPKLKNYNVLGLLAYALGEMCDSRLLVAQPLPVELCRQARDVLKRVEARCCFHDNYQLLECHLVTALKMIEGLGLTASEDAALLAVRNRYN